MYFVVNTEQGQRSTLAGATPLSKRPSEMLEEKMQYGGEQDFLMLDGPSRNSSFHSSEGEGTDHEGDILDCSGSRPLLMDSEEEEEAYKMNPQPQEKGTVSQDDSTLPSPSGVGQVLLSTFQLPMRETSSQGDVFTMAPFPNSRTFQEDLDIFTKAPFVSKSYEAAKNPDEGDVFLRAPFTKKKSQEELASPKAAMESPAVMTFSDSTGVAQYVPNPTFQNVEIGRCGSSLPQTTYSLVSLAEPSNAPLHFARAAEGLDAIPPKDVSKELDNVPSDALRGHMLSQEVILGSKTSKPFCPQSLAKYSRHYTPEGDQGMEAQPIAACKVVSHTNKQVVTGSISVSTLSSRTGELPSSDPFASAPFPSKMGRPKP